MYIVQGEAKLSVLTNDFTHAYVFVQKSEVPGYKFTCDNQLLFEQNLLLTNSLTIFFDLLRMICEQTNRTIQCNAVSHHPAFIGNSCNVSLHLRVVFWTQVETETWLQKMPTKGNLVLLTVLVFVLFSYSLSK